jgi:universal stress protein A
MEKVKRILAPTDFSDLSRAGLGYALEMARNLNAEVIVQHVIPVGEDWFSQHKEFSPVRNLLAEQQRLLDQFLRDNFAESINLVEIRQKVEVGVPHANIVDMAAREEVDMIVMSTHGRTGLRHMLLGSVTEKVVSRASCPVLVIPAIDRKKAIAQAA